MTHPNFALTVRLLRGWRHASVIAALVLASGVLAVSFALLTSGHGALAWWWPAAGVGVAAAVAARASIRPWAIAGFVAVTALAGVLAGRDLPFVAAGALTALVESVIIVRLVAAPAPFPALASLRDVGRFLIGAGAAALAGGALMGAAAALAGGSALATGTSVAASHGSAIAVIVPLVLVNRLRRRRPHAVRAIGFTLALGAAVVIAFAPGSASPLAFLPVPLLAWAAFTQSVFMAYAETVVAIVLVGVLTLLGGGPFASPAGVLSTASLIQIYAVALLATTLTIGAANLDRRRLEDERTGLAMLLHDAFARARNGFVILREEVDRGLSVVEVNPVALELLGPEIETTGATPRLARDALIPGFVTSLGDGDSVTVDWEGLGDGRLPAAVTIEALTRTGYGNVFLVHAIDQRPLREAEQIMERRLAREREIAESLRAVNQQKDDFVASVSHELRTPVTSINGYVEELASCELDDEPREFVAVISRNARRILELVDNVLAVSRTERVTDGSRERVWEVGALVALCLDDLQYSLASRSIRTETQLEGALEVHVADGDLIRVISNLLTNAIKFSPVGALITVSAMRVEGGIELRVVDEGEGIAEDELKKVFDRFYRSPSAVERGIAGTGLGLGISRELVRGMGGDLELRRGSERGTVAVVRLPAAQDRRESGALAS